jgi:hypothetical protein
MKRLQVWFVLVFTALLCIAGAAYAQQRPLVGDRSDPRIGLKAGYTDAGTVARSLELIRNIPKPEGFFNPTSPLGSPTRPERGNAIPGLPVPPAAAPAAGPASAVPGTPAATGDAQRGQRGERGQQPAAPPPPSGLDFANSDLAFTQDYVIMGSFNGFMTFNIEDVALARLLGAVVCPGGQGDVSVHGKLLFMSVEQTRGRLDCGSQGVTGTSSAERFRGVRIFDISDIRSPKQVAAVQTCRGSHTHTLVTDPKDKTNVYIYGNGTSGVRPATELAGCIAPKEDPNTSLYSIDVIQVPVAAPQNAKIVNTPRIFADPLSGALSGLWKGGDYGPGTQRTGETNQCHDITAYPEVGLAAGACGGNGLLLDISNPVNPVRLDSTGDKNFAYWHSATFNNDGTKVIFTDEWGGGTRPRCRVIDPPNWGANAIFSIVDKKMTFEGYYKMPAIQTDQENCVAHNGSLIPVPGRDIMVQGWYQGGVSAFDFTDAAHPFEIAFFDRGPLNDKDLYTGGYWAAYYYNGHIYGSEIARGIDIFDLKPGEFLSQNEIDAAALVKHDQLNVQKQVKNTWPAVPVVARAYLDQLNRSKGILPARATAVSTALGRADKLKSPKDAGAGANAKELDTLAAQIQKDATTAAAADKARLTALAATMKGIASKLR